MKFFLLGLFSIFSLILAVPIDVNAEQYKPTNDVCKEAPSSSVCKGGDNVNDPITGSNGIVLKIANIIAWLGGAIAVIMMIYAGFKYVTSGGDSGRTKKAKDTIIFALVGLVVIVVARTIVVFVLNRL